MKITKQQYVKYDFANSNLNIVNELSLNQVIQPLKKPKFYLIALSTFRISLALDRTV